MNNFLRSIAIGALFCGCFVSSSLQAQQVTFDAGQTGSHLVISPPEPPTIPIPPPNDEVLMPGLPTPTSPSPTFMIDLMPAGDQDVAEPEQFIYAGPKPVPPPLSILPVPPPIVLSLSKPPAPGRVNSLHRTYRMTVLLGSPDPTHPNQMVYNTKATLLSTNSIPGIATVWVFMAAPPTGGSQTQTVIEITIVDGATGGGLSSNARQNCECSPTELRSVKRKN